MGRKERSREEKTPDSNSTRRGLKEQQVEIRAAVREEAQEGRGKENIHIVLTAHVKQIKGSFPLI